MKQCSHDDLKVNDEKIECMGCGRVWNPRRIKIFYSPSLE
jgi:hypothetical protein